MREPRCIICGEKKDGLEVKGDYLIEAIRWVKRNVTGNERNYRLVVCKDDFLKYKKARDSYQRKEMAYVTIGVIFAALLLILSRGNPLTLVYGAGIVIFMFLLSQLSYMPGLDMPVPREKKG